VALFFFAEEAWELVDGVRTSVKGKLKGTARTARSHSPHMHRYTFIGTPSRKYGNDTPRGAGAGRGGPSSSSLSTSPGPDSPSDASAEDEEAPPPRVAEAAQSVGDAADPDASEEAPPPNVVAEAGAQSVAGDAAAADPRPSSQHEADVNTELAALREELRTLRWGCTS
jgi:hypothetical protein